MLWFLQCFLLCVVWEHLCSRACSTVIWSPIAPVIEVDVHWPRLNWPNSVTEDSIEQGCSQATDHTENNTFPSDSHCANRTIYTLIQNRHISLRLVLTEWIQSILSPHSKWTCLSFNLLESEVSNCCNYSLICSLTFYECFSFVYVVNVHSGCMQGLHWFSEY